MKVPKAASVGDDGPGLHYFVKVGIDAPSGNVSSDFEATGWLELFLTDDGVDPPWDVWIGIGDQEKTVATIGGNAPVGQQAWRWRPAAQPAPGSYHLHAVIKVPSRGMSSDSTISMSRPGEEGSFLRASS